MRHPFILLLLLSTVLVGLAVVPLHAAPPSPPELQATPPLPESLRLGVHVHPAWDTSDLARLDAASALDADIIRIGVSWRLLEPQPGAWDMAWYVPQLDLLLHNAQQRGLQVFLMVAETPCWASTAPDKECSTPDANPDSYKWHPPANTADYAAALSFLVDRYGAQVEAWEIWNEPNFPRFWGNAPDASAYTALLQAAYPAIKASDPDALVLGGSLAGADTAYLQAMYAAGAQGFFDALALHPYSGTLPPDACSDPRWSYGCGVEQVRQTMLDAGDDLPIWFTEFGWSSLEGSGGVGEASQAAYLQQAAAMLAAWDYVPVAIWYNLLNTGTAASGDHEDQYGLFRHDHSPKPAADQFRALTADPPPAPSPTDSRLRLGVNMHPLHDPYDAERMIQMLDHAAALDVAFVRIDIHWAWIEVFGPGQAGWNPQQIARLDAFLDAAQARDIAVLATVTESPCWASTDPAKVCTDAERTYDWRYPPADPQDFAAFLGLLAQEYGAAIDYWEIWNEPNIEQFWANPDAATYTALLQAAYPAIKAHDPDAPVLGGALAPRNPTPSMPDIPDTLTYIDQMYAAGARGFFDALSYHPYTDGMEPTWYNAQWPLNSYAVSVPAVRERMLQAGDTSPLWLTESGWTTVGADCADCWTPELPTTEEEQAAYLAEAVDIAQRWDYVAGFAWYELVDRGDSTATSFEDHFGLFRHDLSPKPAAEEFQTLTSASRQPYQSQRLRLGVNMHPLMDMYAPGQVAQQTALADASQAEVIRIDIYWRRIEPDQPGVAHWDWGIVQRLDAFLDSLDGTDIDVVATVLEAPCWATASPSACEAATSTIYPPQNPRDYANFVAALVERYQGKIGYWEIWNEPNLTIFWDNPDPVAYTALLQAAYPAIKAHDPDAFVLGGSLSPLDHATQIDAFTFLDGMYAAGARGFFDALSYHPYTDGMEPTAYDAQHPERSYAYAIPMLRNQMLQAGDDSPIWLTEVGWSTVGTDCSNCWTPELPTTEEEQAAYLAEAVDIAQRWDYVEALLWYELTDTIFPADPTRLEYHFGLFTNDYRPKPAAEVFARHAITLDSLAPRSTYPTRAYTSTVDYVSTETTYVFTSTSSYTVTYTLNITDTALQTGRLRVGARINEGATAYPLAAAGPRYRRSTGAIIEPDDLASSASITLDSHRLIGDFVRLEYIITLDGTSHRLRYDLWLRGGTLVWRVSDADGTTSSLGNFWGFRIGPSAATPAARALTLPYLPDPVAAYGPGTFFSTSLDRSKSNSYRFERVLDEPGGQQVRAYNLGIPAADSAGQIEPLDETGYLAVSPDIADVLPAPQHPPTPFRDDLNHRLTLDLWGVADSWHHPWPFDAVRAWTSPSSALLTITGRAADDNPDCGNGVVVSIRHNDLEIWSAALDNGDTSGVEPQLTVDAAAGDTLYFHINHRGTNNWCDATRWQPVITTPDATYDAAQDWSATQGTRHWRYLEYRGAEGYHPMTWQGDKWAGTRPHSELWQTGGHPGESTPGDLFVRYAGLLDNLERYGLRDLNIIIHGWQRHGYDVKFPDVYPANPEWGGSAAMRPLINSARAAGHRIALHENYADHYPDAPSFSWENVAFNADGSPKECWYNSRTGVQSYCTAADAAIPLAAAQGQQIAADYAPNAAFEDVDTVVEPWRWIDLDVANPTPHTHAEAVRLRKEFFRHQQEQYRGPLSGEGGAAAYAYDPYYAGYVSSIEAQIEGRAGAALIPDFELRAVQPLQANQGMGYSRRFFFPSSIENDPDLDRVAPDTAQQDLYRVRQIAYGHSGWLDGGERWLRASLSDTMTEYYLMRALQTRYLGSQIERIAYDAGGSWLDLGGALAAGVDLFQPRLRLEYADGTRILVNGAHGAGWYDSVENFSHRQETHGWRYQYWDGSSYQDMAWEADTRHWQGPATWCRIDRWAFHPDTGCEPALVWTSPVNTMAQVRAWLFDADPGGGDGVTVAIWHNDRILWSQAIANADPDTAAPDLSVDVAAGDTIAVRVQQNGSSDWDSTHLHTWITYQDDGADHAWTVAPDDMAGPAPTLPANGWIAWNATDGFLAYTAQQADGATVDYSSSAAYLFARARDGRLRTIGDLTTDGTAALLSPTRPGGRDLYVAGVREVARRGTPLLRSSAPFTGSITARYPDSLVLEAAPYPAARHMSLTYYDLPASWSPVTDTLAMHVRAYNLTDQNLPGSPLAVSQTADGGVRLSIHSRQRVLLRREAGSAQAPRRVQLVGPTSGQVGVPATFTAVVDPFTTTTPLTLTWQATDQREIVYQTTALSTTVPYTWTTPGPKQITVRAANAAGQATASTTITISADMAPARIELSAVPASLYADGHSTAQVVARVVSSSGMPLSGQVITFTTTLGSLSLHGATTDDQGETATVLRAGTTPGEALITASVDAGAVQERLQVPFHLRKVFLPLVQR
jgi:beta-glucosidase/6-phospho-beta-glucosidase/beta-galactosidase